MRYPTNLWSHLSLHPSLLRERQGQAWDPRAATLPSGVIQGHLYSDSKTLSEGYYLITSQHYTSDSCTGAGPFCSSPKRHVLSLIFSLSYSSLSAMPPHFFILLPKPFTNSPWSVLWLLHPTSESGSVVSDSLWPLGLYSPWNSPGQNIGVGSCSLLQGIFPTQESNLGLLHLQADSLPAEPQGKSSHKYASIL